MVARRKPAPLVIYVNRHRIAHNNRHPDDLLAPFSVRKGFHGRILARGFNVRVNGGSMVEFLYDPAKPLIKCGAKAVVVVSGHGSLMVDDVRICATCSGKSCGRSCENGVPPKGCQKDCRE